MCRRDACTTKMDPFSVRAHSPHFDGASDHRSNRRPADRQCQSRGHRAGRRGQHPRSARAAGGQPNRPTTVARAHSHPLRGRRSGKDAGHHGRSGGWRRRRGSHEQSLDGLGGQGPNGQTDASGQGPALGADRDRRPGNGRGHRGEQASCGAPSPRPGFYRCGGRGLPRIRSQNQHGGRGVRRCRRHTAGRADGDPRGPG